MKLAEELFTFQDVPSVSPHLRAVWRTYSEPEPEDGFLSVAVTRWEIVVTRQAGAVWMTVRGPETRATPAPIPRDAEFLGIQFDHGSFLRPVDMRRLVDSDLTLPATRGRVRWLDGSDWEVPGPGNADVFVDRLVREGQLAHDPVVPAALAGEATGLSRRTVERRVARATGLTQGTIRQIHRAERAVELLGAGVPAPEVARRAGYADQPHLVRSLRRFVGRTPSHGDTHA
jgi:AraC-like DNA-binding protein